MSNSSTRLVGLPGTFRGKTKAAANAQAQAAFDAFVAASLANGSLTCGNCPPPLFARIEHNDTIVNDGDVFDYTFAGTAGQSVAIYARSDSVQIQITLYDPSNVFVANDDGSDGYYGKGGTWEASAITKTLAATGTYRVRAAQSGPGTGLGAKLLHYATGQPRSRSRPLAHPPPGTWPGGLAR